MSQPAEHYLAAAIAIAETHALHRDRIDWHALRLASAHRTAGASTPADTYDTIRWVLTQLEDHHSFFLPPENGDSAIATYDREATVPGGHLRPDRIAVLRIPGFLGSPQRGTRYADTLQAWIAKLDAAEPVGWIVDLTENGGGNMWPMLAGLGPLLGEGPLGAFDIPHQPPAVWSYRDGQSWLDDSSQARTSGGGYRLRTTAAPVAVLMSARTASSGEAVLIAFCGRPDTLRFGTSSRGLTTANDGFPLPDGATILLTVGTFVDRFGRVYGRSIEPDQVVDCEGKQLQTRAAAWVHTRALALAAQAPRSDLGG